MVESTYPPLLPYMLIHSVPFPCTLLPAPTAALAPRPYHLKRQYLLVITFTRPFLFASCLKQLIHNYTCVFATVCIFGGRPIDRKEKKPHGPSSASMLPSSRSAPTYINPLACSVRSSVFVVVVSSLFILFY